MRLSFLSSDRASRLVAACSLAIFAVAARAAVEPSPYEARVTVPRAQIRSGPGEKFYPTETLAQGDAVEVYREQADGWLAVRPPQGSFSWVFGKELKLREGGLAEVNKQDVASRIGSRLSDKRNAVQVQLKKGEVVEIIGEGSIGGERWYKIAPPAGEFRWIQSANVERVGTVSTPAAQTTEPQPVAASATNESAIGAAETPSEVAAAVVDSKAAPGDQWRSPAAASNTPPPEASAPPVAASASSPAPAAATPPNAATTNVVVGTPDDFARQLTDIELRLSRMAAAPPNLWSTERLARDAEQLLAQAQNTAERDAVKVTLSKIDQFTTLGRRYQQGAGSTEQGAVAGLFEAGASRTGVTDPSYNGRYDAVGILRPVVSKRPGAPQFALVDERGQVLSFVTPSPDMNLQPYLGHRVGIAGNRGFIPEFNRAHVTAGRVTPLSERLVR
jgi:uncharacterized protein YgiM (DUF1202 family)